MKLIGSQYQGLVREILRDLIRLDTTNPPGNEIVAAQYLAQRLGQAGLETEILESAPGRGNLIARYKGTGQAKPLLLMGHLDVVSADPAAWTYPPFAAEIHDGFMWGRGTTDMKQSIAISTVILLALSASGLPLNRDVVLMATADEEHGGRMGMGWLVRERPDLFDVACAINEGGGSAVSVGDKLFYTCQCAEKGLCRTVWTATGPAGHASQPRPDMATVKLSQAVARLEDGYLGGRAIATMQAALKRIASATAPHAQGRIEQLLQVGQSEKAMRLAGMDEQEVLRNQALFYDTVSVTGLRAGDPQSINVIPSTATAFADGRLLPGQSREGFLALLRERAGNQVEIDIYENQYSPGLESSPEAPIVDTIASVIEERCDGAGLVPWQCAGSTDAKHLIPAGVPVYGFVPCKPLPDGVVGAGAHANDERLWLENLDFGLDILFDVVTRFGGVD